MIIITIKGIYIAQLQYIHTQMQINLPHNTSICRLPTLECMTAGCTHTPQSSMGT